MTSTADVVVIGGGTAGCVVAARLSEDPGTRVVLVEDGPDPRPLPPIVADPRRQPELVLSSPYVRMYEAERPDGSTYPLLSGRITGGGSSVNNCVIVRPLRIDFDQWAAFGGDVWSYGAMLPLMRAIESDRDFPDSPLHGDAGPIVLERPWRLHDPADPPVQALLEAAHELGLPNCPDLNVPEPYGVCASPYAIRDGIRQSTAVAYLDAARERRNLTIYADTTARRLILDRGRVSRVEVDHAGTTERIHAERVVLSAGVYHSPQLLELSGIGRPEELRGHGIPVRHELPGVGEGYQDHAVVYLTYQGTSELRDEDVIPKVRLILSSTGDQARPDLHVFLRPSIRMAGAPALLPISVHLLEHRSRGRVRLASTDVGDPPIVEPALLEHAADVEALVAGIGRVDTLVRHPRLARFYGDLLTPASMADVETHVRTTFETYHHGVGTCRLGPPDDRLAVVGADLRVHGIRNLWVADASVLPTIPHANTGLAAILVGEVAARRVRGLEPTPTAVGAA